LSSARPRDPVVNALKFASRAGALKGIKHNTPQHGRREREIAGVRFAEQIPEKPGRWCPIQARRWLEGILMS
jgi:hypothetical protein